MANRPAYCVKTFSGEVPLLLKVPRSEEAPPRQKVPFLDEVPRILEVPSCKKVPLARHFIGLHWECPTWLLFSIDRHLMPFHEHMQQALS
jgi:hypothetical protein